MYSSICLILAFFGFPFITYTLPVQTVFHQQPFESLVYSSSNKHDWHQIEEVYDIFQSAVEHYEQIVDMTLSLESEKLLYNLIHLPREPLNEILYLQAHLIGIDTLTEKQILKMPSIIGKHIQGMNKELYALVETSVTTPWSSLWNEKVLKNKENVLTFLSSVKTSVAKSLIEAMTDYQLIEQIKNDIQQVHNGNIEPMIEWIKEKVVVGTSDQSSSPATTDVENDFLRQHLCNIRSNLLTELDIQFMNLYFLTIQRDLIE